MSHSMTPPDRWRSIADLGPQSSNYLAVADRCLAVNDDPGRPRLADRSGTLQRMRTIAALLVTLVLTLPAVAMPHPCEVEVAQMKKDLEAIRGAIVTIGTVRPSDLQRQMLAGAKDKYDLELRRTTEAQARCERLVREESPDATPPLAAPAPAAAAVLAAPAVETARPAATPETPCLTGCGKDIDCKGDRICVKGACQDPAAR
jgi:hypothetical protein